MTDQPTDPLRGAYAAAGVSIEAADRAIDLMKGWVEKARRPEMIGGLGGFAGLFDASALTRYERPLLATSTDGVGTKVAIAQLMDVHDTIGFDLVGMVVDDLVVCGAEPLFMTDYIACGRVVPERIAAIVKGIAEACVVAGCALIGGETAEHPGLLDPDDYDVAGATTGVVEASKLLGPGRVRPGDVVIAMEASGLHSNGYSLVRHVLARRPGRGLDRRPRRRRLRPHAGRGAARADPHLRQGLPRPRRPHRDPRHVARDRRRARRQPRAGAPRRAVGPPRPLDLDAAAGLRRRTPGRRRVAAPTSRRPSTAASAWCRSPRPSRSTRRSPSWPATASRRGSRARSRLDGDARRPRAPGGPAPRLVSRIRE